MLQSPTALPEKISGYDLANHLLSQGGVEALIRYAGSAETDWLELKAGMCLLPEDRKKGETEKDLYWNIAKEVIALMNTSGGAIIIGIHDKTLNLVPLEENDPRHILAEKGIDGYVREFVRSNVWPSSLSWTYRGKTWELADKQVPTDLMSYHHAPYSGPDGRTGEVVVLLVKPSEKIRLAREDRKSSVLLKRTRGEVGEAIPIYDYDEFDKYKASREVESAFYANVRDQFDREHAAASESAKLDAAIQDYYSGLAVKARKMMAVFTPLDAEENVFSKDDVDQFYSPEAIETFDDEDRWLDDDDEEEDREDDEEEDEEDSDFDEDGDEGVLDSEDDTEDEEDARLARKGDLLELLKSEQRVIVSGEPGGGKTTCLTYFTLKFAERGDDVPILAVFIPMGQWRRGGSLSLMMERATGMDAGQLAHLMSENRLRLVIDAVNECPDDFRVAAIQNIGMFLAEHPTVPAVISTRHPKELAALHLPVFHVQPMDETHRLRYLERYLQNGEQAQKLLHQLGGMPGGETVAENPMLLRLVVEVYKESPEKRLPNGRAGLYRRSLRAWYKRENEKAERAGTKLQWNRRLTFELLAVLAFKSRQRGYRDIPLEEIPAIWGTDAENQLEVLCLGPIIYCDDEFVRFRHETFQEYLCAEYLVAHEDELPSWTQDDYAQWGMPFAYAVELFELDKQQLPESFWLSAWNLNPWLGVALTDEKQGRMLLNPKYYGHRPMVDCLPLDGKSKTPYLRAVCGTFDVWTLWHALREDHAPWYNHGDVALRYVVFISEVCYLRWNSFEKQQLKCLKGLWDKQAIKLSKSWLTLSNPRDLFQYYVPEEWDGWVENASPQRAELLVDARIAIPEDFDECKQRWLKDIKLGESLRLAKRCILDVSDIEKMLPVLIKEGVPEDLAGLIALGFWGNPLIEYRINECVKAATPQSAASMIESGLVSSDVFSMQIQEWIHDASISSACSLVRCGLAQKIDFEKKILRWIDISTPDIACKMIESGIARLGDFKKRLPIWLECSQYSFVSNFLRRYGNEMANEICIDNVRVQRWIESADSNSAFFLIRDGLAIKQDFAERAVAWIDFVGIKNLRAMVTVGLIPLRVAELRVKVHREIQSAIVSHRMPTTEEKQRWLFYCNVTSLVEMVNSGLIDRNDVAERVNCWKVYATPKVAYSLVSSNLAQATDFDQLVAKWMNSLTPTDALALIRCGIIEKDDVAKFKEIWRKYVTSDTLLAVVQLGCLTIEEANEGLSLWGDMVPTKDRKELVWQLMQERFKAVWERCKNNGDKLVVRGRVRNLTDFGAFITLLDFDGIDGLLRTKDMSWMRIRHPDELLKIGQDIEVKVLDIDMKRARISLGLKQLTPNPWESVSEHFPVGTHLKGRVRNLAKYGAFVEIASGIEGLVHVSEFSWTKKITRADEVLSIGDEVEVVVLSVDVEKQSIALSIRKAMPNPWDRMPNRYPVGSRARGKVRNFTRYGAFIELEEGIDGMIHVNEMSWTRKIDHPSECLNIGDEVEAIVLNVDPEKRQIGLGLKQLQQNPWPEIIGKYAIGMVITSHVTKLVSFGAFVELEPGIDGLIHVSEISNKPIEKAKDVLSIGEEVRARVIKADRVAGRIWLSIKALAMTEEELKALKDNNGVVTQESKAGTSASGTSSQVSSDSDADT